GGLAIPRGHRAGAGSRGPPRGRASEVACPRRPNRGIADGTAARRLDRTMLSRRRSLTNAVSTLPARDARRRPLLWPVRGLPRPRSGLPALRGRQPAGPEVL